MFELKTHLKGLLQPIQFIRKFLPTPFLYRQSHMLHRRLQMLMNVKGMGVDMIHDSLMSDRAGSRLVTIYE